jgi:UDP-N-acetylglucosamine 2-epimerase (non-hydrolysing)
MAGSDATMRHKILCIVGARPNFMKIAPIMRAFAARADVFEARLVHTGQHYDVAMNQRFFEQLSIPNPDISLDVGSGSHAVQTAEIMRRFEPVLDAENPDAILVVGDVNSTIACALVAAKKGVKVIHVEAGLRSRDRSMPEEINRILTDQLSDRLYVTEREAIGNLAAEGIASDRVVFAGNVMIDTLHANLAHAVPASTTLSQYDPMGEAATGHAVLTLHRPSNVDDPEVLTILIKLAAEISAFLPVVFPAHPRTLDRIERAGLLQKIADSGIRLLPPQGYLEMLGLMSGATIILTDSGGIQEESTALGVPCLTLRENTERPITIEQGTNQLVGVDPAAIRAGVRDVLENGGKRGRIPELWDGQAATRIAADLCAWLRDSPR